MVECSTVRSKMPELLVESIGGEEREGIHHHIESCPACAGEWEQSRETWTRLGHLEEVGVPAALHARFHEWLGLQQRDAVVVPFASRRWRLQTFAKAAVVVLLVGGSFFAGRISLNPPTVPASPSQQEPRALSLSESVFLPASQVSPQIEGRPRIRNMNVSAAREGEVDVSFDITSRMTLRGAPEDPSLVQLVSYVLQNEDNPTHSRSRVIQWVQDTYGTGVATDPEIVRALAKVLSTDAHEGVRIKAVDALRTLPVSLLPEAREALTQALRNDPNPAVRMKAIDALANLAAVQKQLDPGMLDTLREKAAEDGENVYVRVKAAEVLREIDL